MAIKKITALVGLVSLGVAIGLPAIAGRSGNIQSERAKTGLGMLVAQAGVRNAALELETSSSAFSTLSAALKAAGLNQALAGRGPFTIFAPTNEAFAALPKGTVQSLLRPENKATLARILTYHVVPGKVTSFNARSGRPTTLAGQPLTVRVNSANEITVNGARVILADIPASNGVIHGISQVMLPPSR